MKTRGFYIFDLFPSCVKSPGGYGVIPEKIFVWDPVGEAEKLTCVIPDFSCKENIWNPVGEANCYCTLKQNHLAKFI